MPIISPNATPMPTPRASERRSSAFDDPDDDNALVESLVTGDETQLDCSNSQASGDNFHLWGALLPALPDLQRVDFVKPQKSYTLGRWTKVHTPGVDMRFTASDKISKEHCKISWNEDTDEVIVTDLSTNGTHVNDRRLERGQSFILQQGHEVTFGARSNHISFLYRHFGKGRSAPTARGVFEEYQLSSEIGRGGFGTVRRAIGLNNGQTYAVKVINNRQFAINEHHRRMVEREIVILSQLEHPNIVRWVETFSDPAAIYLVMEFVDGGDLLSLIIRSKSGLPETQARCLTHNICSGVAFLHARDIVHRDLKPENVLVTRNQPMFAKIADFGLAKVIDSETMLNTQCGTPMYVAPEVFLGTPHNNSLAYTPLVDSWSVGAIVYAELTMSVPFPDDDSNVDLKERLATREVQWDHMRGTSDEAQHFCRNLLRKDVRLRFTMAQALMHPWLNDPYIDLSQGWMEEYDGTPPEVQTPQTLRTYVRSGGGAAEDVSHLYSSAEPSVNEDLESPAHVAPVEHLTGLNLEEQRTSSR